jgi:excisionase family DNA binding protein
MSGKLFYTTAEAGLLLGLSPRSIAKYIELGKIVAEKMGRDYVITFEEFERFQKIPRKVGRPSRDSAAIPSNFADDENA